MNPTPGLEAYPFPDDAPLTLDPVGSLGLDGARPDTSGNHGCDCSICTEPLFEALMAPCGHALCASCVSKLTRTSQVVTPQQMMRGIPDEPQVPRCPECRVAVHPSQYRRCYPLEKAAQTLYPEKWKEYASAKKAPAVDPSSPDRLVGEFEQLRVWKAAQEEQAVNEVIKLIWKSIQGCMANSTALLINGNIMPRALPVMEMQMHSQHCPPYGHGPRGAWRGPTPRVHISNEGEVDISEFVQQDVVGELDTVLTTLWNCADEIGRRLKKEGLELKVFKFLGQNHALITWPPIPSTFTNTK